MVRLSTALNQRSGSTWLRAAFGSVVVGTALALGGSHPEVNAVVAVFLVLAFALTCLTSRRRPMRVNLPTLVVLVALGATLMQMLPLPLDWIQTLSPGTFDVLTASLGAKQAWAPLTLDLPATAHEAVKLVALVAAAFTGATLFGTQRQRTTLFAWIAAAGTVVLAVGLLHALVGWERPYGLFGRRGPPFVSTFVNPNHLAGFLGFASMMALGLTLGSTGSRRYLYLANAVLMGGGVLMSMSRGGTICFLGALAVVGLGAFSQRTQHRRAAFWAQVVLAGAVSVGAFVSYAEMVHELWTLTDASGFRKMAVWRPVPAMLKDFPLLGVGRGAFAAIQARYSEFPLSLTFTHLENEWLQTLVDWGPAVGLALVVTTVIAFFGLVRSKRPDPTRLAGQGGLLFLATHNLGDFNLTLTAVALPAIMVFSSLSGTPASSGLHSSPRRRWRSGPPLSACLVAVVVVCVPIAITFSLKRDTKMLAATLRREQWGAAQRERAAMEVISRHPADYLLPLLVAQRELAEPDGARVSLRWVNQSMYMAPRFGPAHRLAARALRQLGAKSQALLEYRLACQAGPAQTTEIAREVWWIEGSPDDVATLASGDRPEVRLAVARLLLRKGACAHVVRILEGAADSEWELGVAVHALLCLRRHEEAQRQAEQMTKQWPSSSTGYLLLARALARQRGWDAAAEVLERGLRLASGSAALLESLAVLELRRGRPSAAREAATRLLSRTSQGPRRARAYALIGRSYEREGRLMTALRHYEYARDHDRNTLGHWQRIAGVRMALGDRHLAHKVLQQARAELGSSPALEEALRRFEATE